MYAYIARRGLLFIPTILLATILVFGLFWIVPGDAAMMILTGEEGDGGKVTEEDIKRVQRELGLDRPVYIQYGDWLWKILQGDFGDSVWYGTPVLADLKDRFFITLELAVLAIVLAFIAAVPLGVLSAVKQDSFLDHISRLLALVGIALPTFWLGILVIYGLTYFAGWLPPWVMPPYGAIRSRTCNN